MNRVREHDDSAAVGYHPPHAPRRLSTYERFQTIIVGLLSALPTLLLIGFGAKPSISTFCIYIALLIVSTFIFIKNDIESGVARWFIGFILLILMSSCKSGFLLASCNNMTIKGLLYAITALWECSNIVLIIGGETLKDRFGVHGLRDVILYTSAPCQVKFVPTTTSLNYNTTAITGGVCRDEQMFKRTIHITICIVGVISLYYLLVNIQSIQIFVTSFILVEVEYLAFMASMAVVLLDLPSHSFQIIHNLLVATPLFNIHDIHTTPKVILPYGWVYSSASTREFWSRWSRPATQLIRHLFYYPLGGRDKFYISIPLMFLLNASSHFDLSYALVGEKREVYWLALFGMLASVAMIEVVGDKMLASVNSDGHVSYPSWYLLGRKFLAFASLRLAVYIMVYLCLKTSLRKMLV